MICKDCNDDFQSEYRRDYCDICLKNRIKKQTRGSSTKRMIRNKEFVRAYKKDKACEGCGYNKHLELLEFHHKGEETKNKRINILMKTLKCIDVIKKEIDKRVLLCPNCHKELHFLETKF